jgi:hypothetical protein
MRKSDSDSAFSCFEVNFFPLLIDNIFIYFYTMYICRSVGHKKFIPIILKFIVFLVFYDYKLIWIVTNIGIKGSLHVGSWPGFMNLTCEPDPAKWCGSMRIRIRSSARKERHFYFFWKIKLPVHSIGKPNLTFSNLRTFIRIHWYTVQNRIWLINFA